VRTDGTVACWGFNDSGAATPPAGTFTQVSAGGAHTCGLRSDGTIACWGSDFSGQATPPAGTFTQVSAGGRHTCGFRSDGTVVCWGNNDVGQATPAAGTFTQVSAGSGHTCGVRSDGTVACWGATATPAAGTFTQVSAGSGHTCGVRSDGTVACWGFNSSGQATPPSGTFTQVSAGYGYTCGLERDASVACWGRRAIAQAPANVSPVVGVIPGATILVAESFTAGGSFTDPDADVWSATVDYGDGSAAVALPLVGQTFSLSHVYAAAGTFVVTVTVSDDDGGVGDGEATVIVQTPQEATEALANAVDALVQAGVLSAGNGTALGAKLKGATAQLARGNTTAAVNQLEAFIRQVTDLVNSGELTAARGQSLIDAANRIIRAAQTS
jgi:hypothetical protein